MKHHKKRDSLDPAMVIHLENIVKGLDTRTTIMIRNIPNKYDANQLQAELNKNHKDRYDFFYLPIDYGNRCNMGYAFINFTHPVFILELHEEIEGKGWNSYNSDKICQLCYGKWQGRAQLKNHFRNTKVFKTNNKSIKPVINENPKMADPAIVNAIIERFSTKLGLGEKKLEEKKSNTQEFSTSLGTLN